MVEESGIVLSVSDGFAEVETVRTSSCTACQAKSACGHHAIAKVSSSNRMRMMVSDTFASQVGQEVVVGIPEDTLLKASIWMYLVPLLGLVLGAVLPSLVSDESIFAAIGSILGLATGLYFARKVSLAHVNDPDFQPKILSIKTKPIQNIDVLQL
ncbi:MAG: SoxR reducing system RseC family protein [Marinomonas sp.]|uniref:SoxR reducing system RseC family protein n=1 Tax=unclassified Marinomonas TaxID=196814 RepID=UPI0005FA3571|nr:MULTISPECIES: SoxR reducing system RseC family protein [unclassified Marinomonas]KJZ14780.1 sigma E positive regulator RseC/MucC [Marinomonas sp. S3726]KZM40866.1 sigma E positive regulator RseC/MucC [Marinomonas sp. SBI22]KZM42706.1 sigma E positive regulator RseC/MucC [Marinomonas sp. SBI8L]